MENKRMKRKLPKAGDIVVVNHENSSETYYFDGKNLVDSVGTMFSDKDIDWNDMWETDKTWRFASDVEKNAYGEELWKNNLMVDYKTNKIVSTSLEDDVKESAKKDKKPSIEVNYYEPDGFPTKTEYTITTSLDVYKAELVRLYELLDDIDFMAQLGKFIDDEVLLTMIRTKCIRRKRFIKDKGRDLFFNGEKLTDNKVEEDE